ncbi:Fc.00g057010.m01.CDS01 [Cosmosporella sp. VM-42]
MTPVLSIGGVTAYRAGFGGRQVLNMPSATWVAPQPQLANLVFPAYLIDSWDVIHVEQLSFEYSQQCPTAGVTSAPLAQRRVLSLRSLVHDSLHTLCSKIWGEVMNKIYLNSGGSCNFGSPPTLNLVV